MFRGSSVDVNGGKEHYVAGPRPASHQRKWLPIEIADECAILPAQVRQAKNVVFLWEDEVRQRREDWRFPIREFMARPLGSLTRLLFIREVQHVGMTAVYSEYPKEMPFDGMLLRVTKEPTTCPVGPMLP